MITAAFWMMVRFMNAENWSWLFRPQELLGNIYTVLEDPLEAVTLTEEEGLPWPVALLLGSHSRKHRFPTPRLLSLSKGGLAAKDLVHRLKWQWKYRNSEREQQQKPLVHRRPIPFNQHVHELGGFSFALMNSVREAFEHANSFVRGSGAACVTTPRFVRWALQWIKARGLSVVLSDKDGTFVLIRESLLRCLVLDQLNKRHYKDVAPDTTSFQLNLIKSASFAICGRIRRMGFKSWAREAESLIAESRPRNFSSRVSCTIKTHKSPGEVCCRMIHSSVGLGLNGLSAVLHRLCSEVLKGLPYICANTREVLKRVRSTLLSERACLCKVDVKDVFYGRRAPCACKVVL
jgi:hypothetical protein